MSSQKSKRAIWIKSDTEEVLDFEYTGLESLQKAVGGYISRGHRFENGDEIFVNDEGLFEDNERWFIVAETNYPLFGNGVVIGAPDRYGNTTDVKFTREQICNKIYFCDRTMLKLALKLGWNPPSIN